MAVQVPFDEAKLCKMFLQTSSAINGDYTFYHPPQLQDDPSRPAYFDALVRRLLEINPRNVSRQNNLYKVCATGVCPPTATTVI